MTATVNRNRAMKKLVSLLNRLDIGKLCRETGFVKRQPRKACGEKFLLGFLDAVFCNQTSLMCLAFCVGQVIGDTLSKVAVHKRLNTGFATLLQRLLGFVLSDRLQNHGTTFDSKALKSFTAVHLQDSTTIALNPKLFAFFPGSANNSTERFSSIKLQLIYDVLSERFRYFKITSFRVNDQKASALILQVVRAGDLVIRDLGYFALDILGKLQQKRAFYLSRLKYGVRLFSTQGDQAIDLVALIKKHQQKVKSSACYLDVDVKIGLKAQLPTRLIVIPVAEQVVNERRRKAKNNRDKRLNPNKEHLFLMAFNIFITNVDCQTWTIRQVADVYALRWRIEVIFKTWKCHFNMTNLPTSTAAAVQAYIYAKLIYITLIQIYVFIPLKQLLYKKNQRHLSLVKVAILLNIIQNNTSLQQNQENGEDCLRKLILYHAAYETRKKRIPFPQMVLK